MAWLSATAACWLTTLAASAMVVVGMDPPASPSSDADPSAALPSHSDPDLEQILIYPDRVDKALTLPEWICASVLVRQRHGLPLDTAVLDSVICGHLRRRSILSGPDLAQDLISSARLNLNRVAGGGRPDPDCEMDALLLFAALVAARDPSYLNDPLQAPLQRLMFMLISPAYAELPDGAGVLAPLCPILEAMIDRTEPGLLRAFPTLHLLNLQLCLGRDVFADDAFMQVVTRLAARALSHGPARVEFVRGFDPITATGRLHPRIALAGLGDGDGPALRNLMPSLLDSMSAEWDVVDYAAPFLEDLYDWAAPKQLLPEIVDAIACADYGRLSQASSVHDLVGSTARSPVTHRLGSIGVYLLGRSPVAFLNRPGVPSRLGSIVRECRLDQLPVLRSRLLRLTQRLDPIAVETLIRTFMDRSRVPDHAYSVLKALMQRGADSTAQRYLWAAGITAGNLYGFVAAARADIVAWVHDLGLEPFLRDWIGSAVPRIPQADCRRAVVLQLAVRRPDLLRRPDIEELLHDDLVEEPIRFGSLLGLLEHIAERYPDLQWRGTPLAVRVIRGELSYWTPDDAARRGSSAEPVVADLNDDDDDAVDGSHVRDDDVDDGSTGNVDDDDDDDGSADEEDGDEDDDDDGVAAAADNGGDDGGDVSERAADGDDVGDDSDDNVDDDSDDEVVAAADFRYSDDDGADDADDGVDVDAVSDGDDNVAADDRHRRDLDDADRAGPGRQPLAITGSGRGPARWWIELLLDAIDLNPVPTRLPFDHRRRLSGADLGALLDLMLAPGGQQPPNDLVGRLEALLSAADAGLSRNRRRWLQVVFVDFPFPDGPGSARRRALFALRHFDRDFFQLWSVRLFELIDKTPVDDLDPGSADCDVVLVRILQLAAERLWACHRFPLVGVVRWSVVVDSLADELPRFGPPTLLALLESIRPAMVAVRSMAPDDVHALTWFLVEILRNDPAGPVLLSSQVGVLGALVDLLSRRSSPDVLPAASGVGTDAVVATAHVLLRLCHHVRSGAASSPRWVFRDLISLLGGYVRARFTADHVRAWFGDRSLVDLLLGQLPLDATDAAHRHLLEAMLDGARAGVFACLSGGGGGGWHGLRSWLERHAQHSEPDVRDWASALRDLIGADADDEKRSSRSDSAPSSSAS